MSFNASSASLFVYDKNNPCGSFLQNVVHEKQKTCSRVCPPLLGRHFWIVCNAPELIVQSWKFKQALKEVNPKSCIDYLKYIMKKNLTFL